MGFADMIGSDFEDQPKKKAASGSSFLDSIGSSMGDEASAPVEQSAPVQPESSHAAPTEDVIPWYKRAAVGYESAMLGLGEIAQKAKEKAHFLPIAGMMFPEQKNAPPSDNGALEKQLNKEDIAKIAEARKAQNNGKDAGLDLWQVAGEALNPAFALAPEARLVKPVQEGAGLLSKVIRPIARASERGTYAGGIGGATQQTDSGSLAERALNTATGAVGGAVVGPLIEGAIKLPIIAGKNLVNSFMSREATQAAQQHATSEADKIVNSALEGEGITQQGRAAIEQQARSEISQAILNGAQLNAQEARTAVANHAKAASLPYPVKITAGEASRNGYVYGNEYNLRHTEIPESSPLRQARDEAKSAILKNLDSLNAETAPNEYDAGRQLFNAIKTKDDALQAQVRSAYKAVDEAEQQAIAKGGKGLLLDAGDLVNWYKNTLMRSDSYRLIPKEVGAIIDEVNPANKGHLPLTLTEMRSIDKQLSSVQASNMGNNEVVNAIRKVKDKLNDLTVQGGADDVAGLYRQAKAMHKQRMALRDGIKAYDDVVSAKEAAQRLGQESVDVPDNFFKKRLETADTDQIGKLRSIVDQGDWQNAADAYMGKYARQAKGSLVNEEGSRLMPSKFAAPFKDPITSARFKNIVGDQKYNTAKTLAETVENIYTHPENSTANVSKSGLHLRPDTSAMKNALIGFLSDYIPGGRAIPFVRHVAEGIDARKVAAKTAQDAITTSIPITPAVKPVSQGSSKLADMIAPQVEGVTGQKTVKNARGK